MKKLMKNLPLLLLIAIVLTMLTMTGCTKSKWPSKAQVVQTEGGTRLMVDGEPLIPVLSYGYFGEESNPQYYRTVEYSKHSQKCVYMIAMGCDFTSESTKESWNEEISKFLEMDPDAYFIFRMSAMAGGEWKSQNHLFNTREDQQAKRYDGTLSGGWYSLASETWREKIEYNYTAGLEWLATQPYADRIIGFQPGNATSFEWVFVSFYNENLDDYSAASRDGFRKWLREKYEDDSALQAAWKENGVTFDTAEIPTPEERFAANDTLVWNIHEGTSKVVDYNEYYNHCYYDAMEHIGKIVHEKSDDSLLVGFLYGYYYSYIQTAYPVNTGAYALTEVMNSENIDFLCATNFYGGSRGLGVTRFTTALIDSLNENNKLFIMEDDTRTHLSPLDIGEWRATDYEQTLAILRRNFSVSAVRDQGLYFMDMHGTGWYNDSDLWEQIAEMRRLWAAMNFGATDGGYNPDIAIVVDDESIWYTATNGARTSAYTLGQFEELTQSGMKYGSYLKCDLDILPESVKIIIMTNTYYMDEEDRANIEALKKDGKVIIWCRAPGYISDDSTSVSNISELIGIKVDIVEKIENEITKFTDETHPVVVNSGVSQFGKLGKVNTVFHVVDSDAQNIGVYKRSPYISFAIKEFDDWVSIFAGSGCVRAEVLCSIAKVYTDIHNYKPDGTNFMDGIESDGTFLLYNPGKRGEKVILLPEYSHVVDNIDNVNKGNSVNAITYNAEFAGDVGMYSIIAGEYNEVSVTSDEVAKTGDWKSVDGALVSTTPGDTLTYTFKGTFVSIIASRGTDKGVIGYTVDGVEYPDINFHTKEGLDGQNREYVLAQNLADSEHTVVITVKEPIEYNAYVIDLSGGTPDYNSLHTDEIPEDLADAKKTGESSSEPSYEMGIEFKTKVPGKITKARLLAQPDESGAHTVTVFDESGTIIAGPFDWNVSTEKTAWCEYDFNEPIEIEADTTYVLSIANATGNNFYYAERGYFENMPSNSVFMNVDGVFGVTLGELPENSFGATSYYRDFVFEYDEKHMETPDVDRIEKDVVIDGFGTVDSSNVIKVTDEERKEIVDSYLENGSATVKELKSK